MFFWLLLLPLANLLLLTLDSCRILFLSSDSTLFPWEYRSYRSHKGHLEPRVLYLRSSACAHDLPTTPGNCDKDSLSALYSEARQLSISVLSSALVLDATLLCSSDDILRTRARTPSSFAPPCLSRLHHHSQLAAAASRAWVIVRP